MSFPGWPAGCGVADRDSITCSKRDGRITHQNSGDIHDQRIQVRRRSMSYEHLRGVVGGTPHTNTGSATTGPARRPHLSLVSDAANVFPLGP
ncbi:putative transcriptional regulatory protein Whib-like WhiB2 [Mycobacterium xenopi 3993]|nr:putative transcriptional regulatory protein Whib-like WhiB2 [Mycobacterium xenopi 3993]